METKTLSIPNISCGHCVNSIKKELSEMDGVTSVEGDPASKSVTLEWDAPATLEKIKDTLKEINYPATD
jgi:copper chaperone CopZ